MYCGSWREDVQTSRSRGISGSAPRPCRITWSTPTPSSACPAAPQPRSTPPSTACSTTSGQSEPASAPRLTTPSTVNRLVDFQVSAGRWTNLEDTCHNRHDRGEAGARDRNGCYGGVPAGRSHGSPELTLDQIAANHRRAEHTEHALSHRVRVQRQAHSGSCLHGQHDHRR